MYSIQPFPASNLRFSSTLRETQVHLSSAPRLGFDEHYSFWQLSAMGGCLFGLD